MAMRERMKSLAEVVRQDPDVTGFGMFAGNNTANTGVFFIALKPKNEGRTATADEVIGRLRPQLAKVQGINLFMQAPQDINVGGRLSRTQYQYTITTLTWPSSTAGPRGCSTACARCRNWPTWPRISRTPPPPQP